MIPLFYKANLFVLSNHSSIDAIEFMLPNSCYIDLYTGTILQHKCNIYAIAWHTVRAAAQILQHKRCITWKSDVIYASACMWGTNAVAQMLLRESTLHTLQHKCDAYSGKNAVELGMLPAYLQQAIMPPCHSHKQSWMFVDTYTRSTHKTYRIWAICNYMEPRQGWMS